MAPAVLLPSDPLTELPAPAAPRPSASRGREDHPDGELFDALDIVDDIGEAARRVFRRQ
jgi:hypothetical protein